MVDCKSNDDGLLKIVSKFLCVSWYSTFLNAYNKMKRISSHTTLLYQIVWPIFSSVILVVIFILMFSIPMLIPFFIIYVIVYVWITPMFLKLKNVWIENDYLLVYDISGKKSLIHKNNIAEISQNASGITPRLVKIKLISGPSDLIRFIPTGGYWIFWQHEIVGDLNKWYSEI